MAKNIFKAALSSIMLIGMAGAALAAPAVATANVNVRSGPGTNYQAVSVLRSGERIDVQGCQAGWCYIDGRNVEGWVSWQYLAEVNRPTRPATVFQFNFGSPPRWNAPRPDHGPSRPGPGRPGHDGPGRPGNDWDGPGRPGNDGPGRPGRPGDDNNWGNNGPGRPNDGGWNGPRGNDDRGRDCNPRSRDWPRCAN